MRHLPPILSSMLLAVVLAAPAAKAEINDINGNAPAATLLLPYFEVDPSNPNGNTLFTSVNVKADVDLYDQPGGSGNVIGMLSAGTHVPFGGCKDDGWCQVTGRGWVWGEFLDHP